MAQQAAVLERNADPFGYELVLLLPDRAAVNMTAECLERHWSYKEKPALENPDLFRKTNEVYRRRWYSTQP